jgi:hypothetical protein
MMKTLSRLRAVRPVLFVAGAALALVAGGNVYAQNEVAEDPMCGMGHLRLCKEVTTCVGYAGTKRCSTDMYYYNP